MKTWAKVEGDFIVAVAEASRAPLGDWQEMLPGSWPGWAARPSPRHRPMLSAGVFSWVDPRTEEQARAEKLMQMQAARDAAVFSTFAWDGSEFDANEVSQSRLLGLRLDSMLPTFTPRAWRLADNSWRVLNATDAAGIWLALSSHLQSQFVRFAQREAAINAAQGIAAIDAITW